MKQEDVKNILDYVDRINSIIGVIKKPESEVIDEEIKEKIDLREKARNNKDFKLADSIRDDLKSRGIILLDTPEGVRWKMEKK
jgi:cysteinyl-tRNA synthetase